jgi:ABC-2 type transport system permease protein
VRATELVLGKMAAFILLGIADTVLALIAAVFVFEVPLRGDLFLLSVASFIFLMGALGWGIFVSAVARSQLLAYQMGMISSFLPAFLLSGFLYAVENMPPVIQVISHLTPSRYFVTLLKDIFLKGVGFQVLWIEIAFLIGYATLVFVAATKVLGRKIA